MKIHFTNIIDYLNNNEQQFRVEGDYNTTFIGFCPLNDLRDNYITWARNPSYLKIDDFTKHKDIGIICNYFDGWQDFNNVFLFVKDPFKIYFSILDQVHSQNKDNEGNFIGATSVIKSFKIGENVHIGEFCFIGENVEIGSGTIIKNNVSIECPAKIGKNVIISSGVVIGEDGFGYFTDIHGKRKRVPHIGGVIIEDDVRIGENVCVSRGCLGNTTIGRGAQIDSLTHIAHNVCIGEGAHIVCNVCLNGSCKIGNEAWIAPGSNIKNQVQVGAKAIIGLGAVVTHDIPENAVAVGIPAKTIRMRMAEEEI